MRRAVLFLILSFSLYAAAQSRGTVSAGSTSAETTSGTAASTGNAATTSTGGFITNGSIGGGYVPLLQTPEASFPSGLATNLPNNPAGISNNPSALRSASTPSSPTMEGVFNTGAADFGMSATAEDGRSLGEVARDYRARRGSQQAPRVYTNADIDRLNQSPEASLSSNLGPQGGAQTNPGQQAAPSSPTTPAVNNSPAQPGQNPNLPGSEVQPR